MTRAKRKAPEKPKPPKRVWANLYPNGRIGGAYAPKSMTRWAASFVVTKPIGMVEYILASRKRRKAKP